MLNVWKVFRVLLAGQSALIAETLALRHQLAVLRRSVKRPRLRRRDRILWLWLSMIWKDWRSSLIIVKPDTVVSWHRQGFRLYWRWKSRHRGDGRPAVPRRVRDLIRRMSKANSLWGAPRIHGELLKLGLEVSQATVSKYMVRHPKPPSQSWRVFLNNHAKDLVSIDINVTESPSAKWTAQQIVEACPWDTAPRYLLRDRDGIYGHEFTSRVDHTGIKQVKTAPRSPWQNPFVERLIGTLRRDCIDHVIVFNENHLRRILRDYVVYYHSCRTHLALEKDSPAPRKVESPDQGEIVEFPMVGGLHHRYTRRVA